MLALFLVWIYLGVPVLTMAHDEIEPAERA
jgi:hypothetical protein